MKNYVLYKKAKELKSEYLINCTNSTTYQNRFLFTCDKYQKKFNKIKNNLKLNPKHQTHDGRMHFVTMAKKYEIDKYSIKYIGNNNITDIIKKIYTQRETN